MALRPDLDGFSHHRGHPKRIRRTAGVALAVTWEPDSKYRRRGREGVSNVDVGRADPDQIVIIQCDQGIVDRLRRTVGRGCDNVLDRDRPSSLEKPPEDQPDQRFLTGGSASDLPLQLTPRLEFLRRQDHEIRQGPPPLLTDKTRVKSVVTPDSRTMSRRASGWKPPAESLSARCPSKQIPISRPSATTSASD